MATTTILSAEVSTADIPVLEALLKKFKAKSIKFEEKDPTKMSKEEFFSKIDKARKSSSRKVSEKEIKEMFGV